MKKWTLFLSFCGLIAALQAQPPCAAGTVSASQTICSGSAPSLLSVSGFEVGGHIQWFASLDNSVFSSLGPGDTLSTYQPGNLTSMKYFRVEVSGASCENAVSNSITITIHQPPTAPTTITGGDNTLCNGLAAMLTATGGIEGSGADYQWGWGNQVGTNLITTTDPSNWQALALTTDTTFWVRRIGTSTCTGTTGGVIKTIAVRPVPSVSITYPGELCQLPGQSVEITNQTAGQQPLQINWASATTQTGTVSLTTTVEINLNLDTAVDQSNLIISSYGFTNAPMCTNNTPVIEVFTVKPRATITSVLHNDLTPSDNAFCQGFGPVEFIVNAPDTVDWESSYFINSQFNTGSITENPYNLQIDSAGTHKFVVDSLWYNTGLACGYNSADYIPASVYSNSVTIKPTPPAVEFVNEAPSILQFCDYAFPLVVDSVARINNLDEWIINDAGYTIKWKNSNDNSAVNLNNVPLTNGGEYFPVFELNGCDSKLNSNSLSFIIDLLPIPDLVQSSLVYPSSICSGTSFDILFNPSENISHFVVSDFDFNVPLSSSNINNSLSYPNIPGSNFSITNSSATATTWSANVYAQNKNISTINPVTCWAVPLPIDILVNPNATFNPTTANFESCQDGPNFTIDPGWNGIGEAEWDDPLGLPTSISINSLTKVIEVDMGAQLVPPGIYPIHISGGYPGSNCTVDTTFTVSIYGSPEIATRILDVDGTICHYEYTHIEVIDPQPNYEYQWSCTGCESNASISSYFLPHWSNPKPIAGIWNDLSASYSVTITDASTDARCSSSKNTAVTVLADYASCPEGIDFFLPNGLSVVDFPALYFQWYDVESAGAFSAISGATNQTYFPNDALQGCDTSKYIVATSLYSDRCWSTTVNCFDQFELRDCDGPKSNVNTPKFLLYPNPVVGSDVILENLSADLEGRYTLEIFDIAGKRLMSEIIEIETIGKKRLRLPSVDQGIYLLHISNSRYSETFKISIN